MTAKGQATPPSGDPPKGARERRFGLPNSVRLLLVEDDGLLRSSIAEAMDGSWCRIVGAVGTSAEAMQIASHHGVDVLLTDLDLGPGPGGVELAHAVRRIHPEAGIVVLTSYVDPRLVGKKRSQFPDGAEYVTKQSVHNLDRLRLAVVRAAVRGVERMPRPASDLALTDTQIETMRLVALGLSNAEIASRRFVTEKSVEVAISRTLKQLGVEPDRSRNTRVEIARLYYAMTGATGAQHGAGT